MIKSISIEGLFNEFDYKISFNIGDITLITGPNGFGKSTILKIIETIREKDLYNLSEYTFRQLKITLDDDSNLEIKKVDNNLMINLSIVNDNNSMINEVVLEIPEQRFIKNVKRVRTLPFIETIDPNEYVDLHHNYRITYDDARKIRNELIHGEVSDILIFFNMNKYIKTKKELLKYKELDKKLVLFKEKIGDVKFIREQRLLRKEIDEESKFFDKNREIAIEVINEIPNKIKEEIKAVVLKYSTESSRLDSTFPNRLFRANEGIEKDEYINKLNILKKKQEKIQFYNLLSDFNSPSTKYKESYSQALSVYLNDTIQKLEVFNELINKLDLFVNIVNSKLNFKEIVITSKDGLVILKDDGTKIDANKLSSGEQQIIVLYYELIFGSSNNLTLLIDEPEISLHVAWQRELLSDFKKIIRIKRSKLSLIIATHSPQVIDNNWDSVVDLGEQYGK